MSILESLEYNIKSLENLQDKIAYLENSAELLKKDVRDIARNYLFEYNDNATLTQISNIVNKYLDEWIATGVLVGDYSYVTVSKNPYSDEAVDDSKDDEEDMKDLTIVDEEDIEE